MTTYDPDQPQALVDAYNAQAGLLHTSKKNNAFALLDDERNIIDFYITDVDGEFMFGVNDVDPLDSVVTYARSVKANNIIILHNHDAGPSGPCDGLMEFVGGCAQRIDNEGLALRGCIVTICGKVDGVVYAQKVDSTDERVETARELLTMLNILQSLGDPNASLLIPLMEQSVAAIERGEEPNEALLDEMIAIISNATSGDAPAPQPTRKPSVLDLPALDLRAANKSYLN